MPDVGEGVAEAEIVEWHVKPGDAVREDTVLAAVMTDKATVEIPSPVAGTVTWLAGGIGDSIAVKAPLVRIALEGQAAEPQALDSLTETLYRGLDSRLMPAARANVGHHLKKLAAEMCDKRIVAMLEGGYVMTSLARSVGAHLRSLADL